MVLGVSKYGVKVASVDQCVSSKANKTPKCLEEQIYTDVKRCSQIVMKVKFK